MQQERKQRGQGGQSSSRQCKCIVLAQPVVLWTALLLRCLCACQWTQAALHACSACMCWCEPGVLAIDASCAALGGVASCRQACSRVPDNGLPQGARPGGALHRGYAESGVNSQWQLDCCMHVCTTQLPVWQPSLWWSHITAPAPHACSAGCDVQGVVCSRQEPMAAVYNTLQFITQPPSNCEFMGVRFTD